MPRYQHRPARVVASRRFISVPLPLSILASGEWFITTSAWPVVASLRVPSSLYLPTLQARLPPPKMLWFFINESVVTLKNSLSMPCSSGIWLRSATLSSLIAKSLKASRSASTCLLASIHVVMLPSVSALRFHIHEPPSISTFVLPRMSAEVMLVSAHSLPSTCSRVDELVDTPEDSFVASFSIGTSPYPPPKMFSPSIPPSTCTMALPSTVP